MGALFILGALAFLAVSSSSSSSRRRRAPTAAPLSPHDAAMRAGWRSTQEGAAAGQAYALGWLQAPGRTPQQAGAFVVALQGFHQDALAEWSLTQWNRLRAPAAAPPGPSGDLALGPQEAAAHCGDQSSEDACDAFIAAWLAVPSRTSVDAARFMQRLQALGLDEAAEYALDLWNQHPRTTETA